MAITEAHPPTRRHVLRKAQIIAAARSLVSERGLDGLTIAALEERLEFSRGVITYHFANKDEITMAVLQNAVDEINAATESNVRAQMSFEQKLRAIIGTTVQGFLEHRDACIVLVNFWSRIPTDPAVAEVNARLYASYRDQTASLIQAGQADGAFAANANPDALAAVIVGIVLGLVTQSYFEVGAVDAEAAIEAAVSSIIAGLTSR
jgi:AcrR family transcriptional regulator